MTEPAEAGAEAVAPDVSTTEGKKKKRNRQADNYVIMVPGETDGAWKDLDLGDDPPKNTAECEKWLKEKEFTGKYRIIALKREGDAEKKSVISL